MKRTAKGAEPPALADVRAESPGATWDELRTHTDAYGAIRSALASDQGNVCAYCEIRIVKDDPLRFRVEHAHSKSAGTVDGVNIALQWENLLGVCSGGSQTASPEPFHRRPLPDNLSCDAHKQHLESTKRLPIPCSGIVLNPLEIPAFPNLFRYEYSTGKLLPNDDACAEAGIDPEIVHKTVGVFNLNCDRLCDARKVVAHDLEHRKKFFRTRNIPANKALPTIADHVMRTRWPQFFTTIRAHLGSAADDWLRANTFAG